MTTNPVGDGPGEQRQLRLGALVLVDPGRCEAFAERLAGADPPDDRDRAATVAIRPRIEQVPVPDAGGDADVAVSG